MKGNLQKLRVTLTDPVQYQLPIGDEFVALNPLLGQKITLHFTGAIHCMYCKRKTNKSFSQGYCFPCFRALARCDSCILKPEQCHYFKGTCREPKWGEENCLIPHVVYLANTSGIKVGITRHTQIPIRWIDQGATQALPVMRVAMRYHAGLIEQAFKQQVADKTNWRQMLSGNSLEVDLQEAQQKILAATQAFIEPIIANQPNSKFETLQEEVIEIHYPVLAYPTKVVSLSFDKTPNIAGKLLGIKGQYLILDCGVLNIRNYGGYEINFAA